MQCAFLRRDSVCGSCTLSHHCDGWNCLSYRCVPRTFDIRGALLRAVYNSSLAGRGVPCCRCIAPSKVTRHREPPEPTRPGPAGRAACSMRHSCTVQAGPGVARAETVYCPVRDVRRSAGRTSVVQYIQGYSAGLKPVHSFCCLH